MSNNNEQIEELLKNLSEKLGTSPEELKESAQKKDFSHVFDNLSANDAERIKKVLSDKDATEKILSTPKAQKLLNKLLGDKWNG